MIPNPPSFADRDRAQQDGAANRPLEEILEETSRITGRTARRLARGMWATIEEPPNYLSGWEFFQYRLYDKLPSERATFLSEWHHWPMEALCNDRRTAALTTSKFRCTSALQQAGIATPPVVALISKEDIQNAPCALISSGAALEKWLVENQELLPLFTKPDSLMGSFGVFSISAYVDGKVRLHTGEELSPHQLLEEFIGDETYILQSRLQNHPAIAQMTESLATLRVANLMDGSEVLRPYYVLKLPAANNIADNYWRPGNLLCNVDSQGRILRAITGKGVHTQLVTEHPDSRVKLIELQLPYWQQALNLADQCAELFSAAKYHTLDIAFTSLGPTVIEVNSGGAFDLPQLASDRGLLTPDFKAFFERAGYDFSINPIENQP